MVKPFPFRRLIRRSLLIGVGWLLLVWGISACNSNAGTTAVLTPTAEPVPTAAFSFSSGPTTSVESSDHTHPLNAPEHIHLDDGSVITTDGLPLEDELLVQLLTGEPIAVGPANASAQTVALTVPTMF